jgi:DNA invertase Pin-like site-specific DNA recombinase
MTMTKRAAIYLRVSTDGQTTDNQRLALEQVAAHRGWQIVETYTDHGISGAKARDKRPAFDQMCNDATRGKFDVIAAWSIDRIGRSVLHVSTFMAEMAALNVSQYYDQQNIDTSTPAGKAMLQMCVVFSEFERSMIRERVMAGLARARKEGKRLGRPKLHAQVTKRIAKALARGDMGMIKIAKKYGVGVGSVQRLKHGTHVSMRDVS